MSDSEDENESQCKQIKLVLLGEPATGKTSLAQRLCKDMCPNHHQPTPGVEFLLKRTVLPSGGTQGTREGRGLSQQQTPQSTPVTVEVWDVGGDALDGNMIDQYIFGAQVVLLVFDIASAASLDALTEWLDKTRKVTDHLENRPLIVVIGNKFDLEHERAVRYDRQLKFVHENGLSFHCVSSKTGENVETCFQKILADVFGIRLTKSDLEKNTTVVRAQVPEPSSAIAPDVTNQKSSMSCILQ